MQHIFFNQSKEVLRANLKNDTIHSSKNTCNLSETDEIMTPQFQSATLNVKNNLSIHQVKSIKKSVHLNMFTNSLPSVPEDIYQSCTLDELSPLISRSILPSFNLYSNDTSNGCMKMKGSNNDILLGKDTEKLQIIEKLMLRRFENHISYEIP